MSATGSGISAAAVDQLDDLLFRGESIGALRLARGLLAAPLSPADVASVRLATARALIALGRDDEAIEELIAIEGALPDVEAARTAALVAELRVVTGQARTTDEAMTALDAGLRIRDPGAIAAAWQSLATSYYYRGDLRQSVRAAEERLRWSREPASRSAAVAAVGIGHMHADEFDAAVTMLEEAAEIATSQSMAVHAVLHRALLDIHAGRWESVTTIDEIIRTATLPDWLAGLGSGILAVTQVHRDRIDDAVRALDNAPAVTASAPRPMQLWATMLIEDARGRPERAGRTAERLVRVTDVLGSPIRLRLYGPDVVRVALRANDHETAGLVARTLATVSDRAGVASVTAAAHVCRGLIERDPALIGEASDLYEAGPRLFEAAMARTWHAEALRDAGRIDEAIQGFDTALTALSDIGAQRRVREVERALRQLGQRPGRRGRRGRATTGWASLTPTEVQVAELVGQGLSNSDVARRLVISPRTVEGHLAHAFAKLDVASRTQLVLVVRERESA